MSLVSLLQKVNFESQTDASLLRLMLNWRQGSVWASATFPVPTGMDSSTLVPLIIRKVNSI